MRRLKSLGARHKRQAKAFYGALRSTFYVGTHRYCPICDQGFRRFLPGRRDGRPEAFCPRCGSAERHRLLWLYLHERTDVFTIHRRVLHIAPELFFERVLSVQENLDYVSGDLSGYGMMELDVTNIPFSDASFDIILCSHVLEHVPDDARAMRELRRVLKPSGWAILQVPITAPQTVEDPRVTRREERLRLYGQEDHVRRYGPDYVNRLAAAGFDVEEDHFVETLDSAVVERLRLDPSEVVFVARPRSPELPGNV